MKKSPGTSPEGPNSFTILTTTPNTLMTSLHDRMPVILEPEEIDRWLNPDANPETVAALLDPAPNGVLHSQRVSTRVNSPRNDDATLTELQSSKF